MHDMTHLFVASFLKNNYLTLCCLSHIPYTPPRVNGSHEVFWRLSLTALRGSGTLKPLGAAYAAFFRFGKPVNNQKISIFSMSTEKPMLMLAGLVKNVLVISEVHPLSTSITEQLQKLPGNIKRLRDSGFKVLVYEETPTISPGTGASMVSLGSKHHDGRPVLVVGIERYRELSRKNLISFPKGVNKGNFEISSSSMDVEYKATGEAFYKINWQDIRPENTLLILCCYATAFHNVATDEYIQQMNGESAPEEESGLFSTIFSIIDYQNVRSANEASKSLVGKRIDADTVQPP